MRAKLALSASNRDICANLTQVLHIPSSPAVFLLPPASAGAAWFSGVTALISEDTTSVQHELGSSITQHTRNKNNCNDSENADGGGGESSEEEDDDDDDPFMDRVGGDQPNSSNSAPSTHLGTIVSSNPTSTTTAGFSNAQPGLSTNGSLPIAIQAHEAEIDDCLRCAVGGYQHFRLALTDARRGLAGATMVERTGGEFLKLTSDCLQFGTTKSYCGVSCALCIV